MNIGCDNDIVLDPHTHLNPNHVYLPPQGISTMLPISIPIFSTPEYIRWLGMAIPQTQHTNADLERFLVGTSEVL